MSWFEKLLPSRIRTDASKKKGVPEGLWTKCPSCDAVLYRADLERNLFVCPKCSFHLKLEARLRLELLLDDSPREEIAPHLEPIDFLKFRDSKKYKDRISSAQKNTGEKDALISFAGRINGLSVVACAFEYNFIGGSMGAVVGEKFVLSAKHCLAHKKPLICFSASGGARMQEALISLMQMSKTAAIVTRLNKASIPFISVLTDPTMGGVSASFAMLGDVIIAEPGALIGFAGPRVIEQTVRETLPQGFQRSEFLLEHGAIDLIVDRRQMKTKLTSLLTKLTHHHVTDIKVTKKDKKHGDE